MNVFEEHDPMLDDHINKCRCCFRTILSDQNSVKITKAIEQKFFDLTSLELIQADNFSSKICQLCDKDLEIFQNFRRDLMQKQRKLYNSVGYNQNNLPMKPEINEFIDCNPIENESIECTDADELLENIYEIKEIETTEEEKANENQEEENIREKNDLKFKMIQDISDINHELPNKFLCDKCNFEATEKSTLERHLKIHSIKESQLFFCEMCGLSYGKRHLLNRHVKVKHTTKERKFKCTNQNCDKAFYTLAGLKKHSETHSEKALPCEYCGKLFSCLNNLRTHLYYHAEPKFSCDFEGCGKKFFMRKLWKSHMKVHKGQKDFDCEFCDKSYFFQAHLKRHVISMHMKLKIDCELCPSSFARKETYRNHIINQHPNLTSEEQEVILAKIRNMKVEDYRNTSR
ncbi:hypothetical protein PVAND_017551 [Polypedilum vanderplanki]|uniref:Zinc finger protein n=1 Tax=Polypedilum vanderplanki TaxID=319348 RepID=A0A9J6BIM2_POLVA|nr:hypothetical protein PVAND_017551 [Polypedilum vanderplanki]